VRFESWQIQPLPLTPQHPGIVSPSKHRKNTLVFNRDVLFHLAMERRSAEIGTQQARANIGAQGELFADPLGAGK